MGFIKNIGLDILNDTTRKVKDTTIDTLSSTLSVTVTYRSMSTAFQPTSQAIDEWVLKKMGKRRNHVTVESYNDRKGGSKVVIKQDLYTKTNIKLDNFTYVIYEPRAINEIVSMGAGPRGGNSKEIVSKITITGLNYGKYYAELCQYINKHIKGKDEIAKGGINITNLGHGGRENYNYEKVRHHNTVLGSHIPEILNGVKGWEKSKRVYERLEIPYKLGILLIGPPGTGKTSAVKVLATETNRSIININPSLLRDKDELIEAITERRTENSILLLEDIDRIIIEYKKLSDGTDIIGTLLNLLDGVTSMNGTIIAATANEIHELPEAMIRPGRFDLVINVDGITDRDVKILINRYKIKSMNVDLEYIRNHDIGCYDKETGLYNPSKVQNILMSIKTQEAIKEIQ